MNPVVIDANILFAALMRADTRFGKVILTAQNDLFYIPRFAIIELFKHKERIVQLTNCPEVILLELYYRLLKRLQFMDEDLIAVDSWREAWELVKDIDEKDVSYLAMTIELNARLWTNDMELKNGLKSKGFDHFYQPFSTFP